MLTWSDDVRIMWTRAYMVPSFLLYNPRCDLVKRDHARKINVVMVVGSAAPLHFDAVMGPSLTICRATSLRTCSQTGTPLRPMQRAFGTTTLLSLPLQSTSPMALALPTWTRTSLEPKKSQLFLPMLAPKPPVSTTVYFIREILLGNFNLGFCLVGSVEYVCACVCVWEREGGLLSCPVLISYVRVRIL